MTAADEKQLARHEAAHRAKRAPSETLTYRRPADARRDGYPGILCVHTWATGYQELVFRSVEAALDRCSHDGITPRGFERAR